MEYTTTSTYSSHLGLEIGVSMTVWFGSLGKERNDRRTERLVSATDVPTRVPLPSTPPPARSLVSALSFHPPATLLVNTQPRAVHEAAGQNQHGQRVVLRLDAAGLDSPLRALRAFAQNTYPSNSLSSLCVPSPKFINFSSFGSMENLQKDPRLDLRSRLPIGILRATRDLCNVVHHHAPGQMGFRCVLYLSAVPNAECRLHHRYEPVSPGFFPLPHFSSQQHGFCSGYMRD